MSAAIVDVHVHFVSPAALEAARHAPGLYGLEVVDLDGKICLKLGDAPHAGHQT